MKRRSSSSIVANPVLVGAVTTLVVVIAVFLAYNANSGLPFVPTTQLKIQVSNGANLLPGNEIREGGERIGLVSEMRAVRLPDGTVGAEATLKVDKKAGAIPTDSTISLRPKSVLGLKYVELTRGRATSTFSDGEVLPATQTRFPVDLEEFYRIYDRPTRAAIRENLRGTGDALTQRGAALNEAIEGLPRLLRGLEPVARTLADPTTNLPRFFRELGDAARVLAPVSDRYANQFTAAADTFEAWSRDPDALRATVRKAPPTLDAGIRSFRVQRPFLRDTVRLATALEQASAVLPSALPPITRALRTGIPINRRIPPVNAELEKTFVALDGLVRDPLTGIALRGLTRTGDILNPLLRFVGPNITVCNYFNYAWTHAGEHLSEPDPTGSSQRTLLNQASRPVDPTAPSLASIGARTPVNGEPTISGVPMNFHTNVYSAAIDREGDADCESGQRGYLTRLNTFGDPRFKTVVDPHIPGNQGTTFTGRARVPAGQTFTRAPQSGPRVPEGLDP
jgi:ABC-type transporter Mla subunit MlaD